MIDSALYWRFLGTPMNSLPMDTSTLSDSAAAAAVVWLNGDLVAESEARISPFDHGLLTGDGVFETLIAYQRKPFAFSRHYERLKHSASVFGLHVPEKPVLREALDAVIRENPAIGETVRLRITVTGGIAPLGSEKGESGETVAVAAAAPPKHGSVGHLVRVPEPRNERGSTVGLKTISYGENVIALATAKRRGGTEAIFENIAGNLCEGTGSNIFIVRDGTLITPPLSAGCLAGVTRALVLDLCEDLGIDVKEIDTPAAELDQVDEAFLTSTLREVQSIATVDGKEIPCPGPYSERLASAFKDLIERELDP